MSHDASQAPPLLDAAARVLADGGIKRFTLERIAAEAGKARVTIWRQGVTVEALLEGLLARLADDYRATLWPVLTGAQPGAARLNLALRALCETADRHLAILQADDELFHRAAERRPGAFVEPLERLLRDGASDGTIELAGADPAEVAMTLFNTVVWAFVHLRSRHGWTAARAADNVIGLVLRGLSRV